MAKKIKSHKRHKKSVAGKNSSPIVRSKCPKCGYQALHVHKKAECPMCENCPQCGNRLIECECKEGE